MTSNVSLVFSFYIWHSLFIFSSFDTPEDAYVSESARDF